jgi:hypothetical protein
MDAQITTTARINPVVLTTLLFGGVPAAIALLGTIVH